VSCRSLASKHRGSRRAPPLRLTSSGCEPDALATELLDAAVQRYNRKLAKLREAIDAGDASGEAPEGAFNRVRARLGLPAR